MSGWRSKKVGGGAVCLTCLGGSMVSFTLTVVTGLTGSGFLLSGKISSAGSFT